MKKIIERVGHEPWPKLFINCRSTRRTELQRQYPDHVINKWLGHSSAVAEQHYLQVTKDDWTEGATRPTISEARQTIPQSDDHKCRPNDSGGNAGGNAGGNTHDNTGDHSGPAQEKSPQKPGYELPRALALLPRLPRKDSKNHRYTRGIAISCPVVVAPVVTHTRPWQRSAAYLT